MLISAAHSLAPWLSVDILGGNNNLFINHLLLEFSSCLIFSSLLACLFSLLKSVSSHAFSASAAFFSSIQSPESAIILALLCSLLWTADFLSKTAAALIPLTLFAAITMPAADLHKRIPLFPEPAATFSATLSA